jgi:CBS domain-containing protein
MTRETYRDPRPGRPNPEERKKTTQHVSKKLATSPAEYKAFKRSVEDRESAMPEKTKQMRRPHMKVSEAMTSEVDIIDPNAAIRDAARRMRDDNVGALPVGENDRLIGMVTDRDIVVRGVAENRLSGATSVRDVMSEHIYYCFEDDDLERAATIMAEHQVRRLPVLNRNKRLVGIIAMADLARLPGEAAHQAIEGVSEPSDQPRR